MTRSFPWSQNSCQYHILPKLLLVIYVRCLNIYVHDCISVNIIISSIQYIEDFKICWVYFKTFVKLPDEFTLYINQNLFWFQMSKIFFSKKKIFYSFSYLLISESRFITYYCSNSYVITLISLMPQCYFIIFFSIFSPFSKTNL